MPRPSLIIVALCLLVTTLSAQETRSVVFGGQEFALESERDFVAIGHSSRFRLEPFLQKAGDLIQSTELQFSNRRILVFKTMRGARDELIQFALKDPSVTFANPVASIAPGKGKKAWYIETNELVTKFVGSPNPNHIQRDLDSVGAELARTVSWFPGAFVLRVAPGKSAQDVALELEKRSNVEWAQPNWLRYLGARTTSIPNDPLFANLWHLSNTGQGGGLAGADIDATLAWDHATGQGVTIAVIDTGVDMNHGDLRLTTQGYSPVLGPGSTTADDTIGHGTRCAGVAAAIGNNNSMLCGIAYDATVLPIKLLDGNGFGTATDEASCFIWATDNGADIITNSWGPDGVPFPLPTIVNQAFSYATTMGRNGLGCAIFWAAGNGNEPIGPDQYVGSSQTISIGATTNYDVRSSYSDYGVELDLVAPSSGGSRAINTTDMGGGTTLNFGGTSSSAPLAAGVAALVLELAPGLNWVQVRDALRNSAEKIQPAVANYDSAGHSLTYGHGRLNADKAVQEALTMVPDPLTLSITTTGIGDITIDLTNMGPFHVWVIGFSAQIYNPIGSGPIYGVGTDSLQTIFMPFGVIPFHYIADAAGTFHWGAYGLPAGLTLQAVAFEILQDYSFRPSNVIQVTF